MSVMLQGVCYVLCLCVLLEKMVTSSYDPDPFKAQLWSMKNIWPSHSIIGTIGDCATYVHVM